ncbi:ATP-dependent DNA helicase hus2 [Trichuris trichiura]|uniref:ATP-dependent DNA helicase hus2 n=1 Tax=Trichuris trichiura TaxID=36087 RepID=A0A077YWH2_TRITR|nr:ATP-dependent DNA helicase hus2 [Trichuris trichiura]
MEADPNQQQNFPCAISETPSVEQMRGTIRNEYGTIVWHVAASRQHIYNSYKKPIVAVDVFGRESSSIELQCARATCTIHWHPGEDMQNFVSRFRMVNNF